MTTVDINTGAFVGHRNLEETIFNTNVEATAAIIARHLRRCATWRYHHHRLHRHAVRGSPPPVLHSLELALASDRAKTNVNGFPSSAWWR